MVVSTLPEFKLSQDVTLERTVQNFKFTLFRDPGFFKFCVINKPLAQKSLSYVDGYLSFMKEQQEKQQQRSAWEDLYLEHIKKFDIPLVADD